jgi:hypothetical protein
VKFQWSNKTGLLAGLALIIVTNAIALGGVAYNRSGEAESVLKLTERELPIVNWTWPDNDNSSIDLRLDWRVRQSYSPDSDYRYWGNDWLSQEQLRALGFDTSLPVETDEAFERTRREVPKTVFLVLEYDGPAYQEALEQSRERVEQATELAARNAGDARFEEQLKDAREALADEEDSASRLFIVDASLDPEALRERYPDRARYSIVRGRVGTHVVGEPGKHRIAATPPDLDIDQIRVPQAYRTLVEPLRDRRHYVYNFNKGPPRFSATVNFGRRLEPWIVQMQSISCCERGGDAG